MWQYFKSHSLVFPAPKVATLYLVWVIYTPATITAAKNTIESVKGSLSKRKEASQATIASINKKTLVLTAESLCNPMFYQK